MFLGIEIGGTKLQLGVGPGDGTIVALERAKVDAAGGADRIRQQIIELVPVLVSRAGLSRGDIRAVGIGFGGPVDTDRGIVTKSHQVEGWAGFPLADWSRRELGWRTVVHNDADTAGLAEACFGAGRGYSPIFYITIGSGIGGGLIIDQKIYRGAGAGAGEIGHLRCPLFWAYNDIFPDLERPGDYSTIESCASGWGIAEQARKNMPRFLQAFEKTTAEAAPATNATFESLRNGILALLEMANDDPTEITAEMIAAAAEKGNKYAQAHLRVTTNILGWAVASIITLVCPRRIVIGGGVSKMGEDLLFSPLRRSVQKFVFAPFAECYGIVPAALGEAVVVHGALRLAREADDTASK